jgi:3-(3-hydroxy-phenyl)propionate hydroxylase
MGLKLEGASYEGFFVIADIKIDLPYPTERLAFFDPEWNRGNTILMHREPQGIWRIDYQLPPGETPEQALQPASLKERINAQLAMIGHAGVPWEMDWSSVYSARTLTLPDYQHGRTLFVGDAAHLLPIFGVRGANTAFQDAQSLGWHLAMVCKGITTDKFLQNFSTERVTAAREIITESGKSTRFMAPPSRGFRLLRDAVLSLSLTQAFVRPLYHWRTSRPHEYTHSVLNSREDDNALFETGPSHGVPPQNVRLNDGNFLLDHLGGGFDLLYFVDDASHLSKNIHASGTTPLISISSELQSVISAFKNKGLPIQVIAIGTSQPVEGADLHLEDRLGRVKSRYGITKSGGAYLLRPDQHICARWQELDAKRLHSTLQAVLDQ